MAHETTGGGGGEGGWGGSGGEKTSSLADSESEGDAILQPLPLGAPLPPLDGPPHAVIAPDASSAAKEQQVEEMLT